MMNGASMGLGAPRAAGRDASESILSSLSMRLPVAGSMRAILRPDQKLPHESQYFPSRSTARFGSMALNSSCSRDRTTSPLSTHSNPGAAGSSVLLVARPITEWFEPKLETE